MSMPLYFTFEHRYQGVHVADVDAIAWIETHAPYGENDWSISRIVFCSIGGEHEVDVIGDDRKAAEKFFLAIRGIRDDIADRVLDCNDGRFISDRQLAMSERVGR
jgi:hypothetical protein